MEKTALSKQPVLRLTQMAMLAALSVVLVYLIHFPIFPGALFLEYDPADIFIIMGTLMFGPLAGLSLTVVVSVVQGLTVSAGSGLLGIVMHIAATGSYVLVAGLIYRKNKTTARAVVAMLCGTVTMCVTMVLWNILLTPIFMNAPREEIMKMIIPIFVPFNLIKAGANSIVAFILFKTVGSLKLWDKSRM